jgi:hypothetical protein
MATVGGLGGGKAKVLIVECEALVKLTIFFSGCPVFLLINERPNIQTWLVRWWVGG